MLGVLVSLLYFFPVKKFMDPSNSPNPPGKQYSLFTMESPSLLGVSRINLQPE